MTHTISSSPAPCSASTPASEQLIEVNLPLVGHIVRETAARLPGYVNRDDLVSAGMTALVLAARSFDAERGVPFGRFAAIRIRGALIDELRSMDWASRSVRGRARELDTVRTELTNALGRAPKQNEVASALGVTISDVHAIDADVHRASVLSVEGFAPESGAAALADSQRGPEQILLDREQLGYLRDAIDLLPERLQFVVRSYFFEQRQMGELAVELGVTESRISQMRAEALKLLRQGMAAQYNDSPVEVDAETPATSRSQAKVASYAAAIAARGSLRSRIAASDHLGEQITTYAVA
jgi:RNA polymerase sigma factor for flagellar operon FliA